VTTHSPIALANSTDASLWFKDAKGGLGELPKDKIKAQQKRDPETFLWKVPIVVEGETEMGFLSAVLEKAFPTNPLDAGVRVSLGQGDDQLLGLLEALEGAKVQCSGFVDADGKSVGRWTTLKTAMGNRLFQWPDGCIETNIIGMLPDDYIDNLFSDADGDLNGYRLRTIADRLNLESKDLGDIKQALQDTGQELRQLILDAATGNPEGIEDRSVKKKL